VAPFLRQISGRKIDGDAFGRQRQPYCRKRATCPLTALYHRLVGQADEGEGRETGRDLHLHIDRFCFYALEREC